MDDADIIYDWNAVEKRAPLSRGRFTLHDETLRDGLQSPSVRDPAIEDKLQILRMLDALGIETLDIGLPGAGPRAVADCTRLSEEIRDGRLRIQASCAARTHLNDIIPIVEISQKVGIPLEVMTFIGSSPIRQFAEDWDLQRILKLSAEAIDFAVKHGLRCTYVTEDTTRSRPEVLAPLFKNAIDHGADRLCLCDTVGHATPDGIRNLLAFTRGLVVGMGLSGRGGIDWHGHNDRGLGVTNAIYAIEYGADRAHGTILGVGERVGNAALDQMLVNLRLLGELDAVSAEGEVVRERDLRRLADLVALVSKACQVPVPYNYPVFGADAFRTATGVHAAAIIKAERKGDAFLADRIYSSVPAELFGRRQEIEIGYMSGESNVVYWLQQRGVTPEPELVKRVLRSAKHSDHLLTADEVYAIIGAYTSASGRSMSPSDGAP